jgi:hypothetical protein
MPTNAWIYYRMIENVITTSKIFEGILSYVYSYRDEHFVSFYF